MKNYKKALLASLATIGTSCVLVGGATFALFTSDSTTNIAVTSGKVDVRAEVVEDSLELYSMGEKMEETFATGGTATYEKETNNFNINKIVAGDHIEFKVVIKNHSTIAVKYQSVVTFAGDADLFNALDVTMGDLEFVGMSDAFYTNWSALAVGQDGLEMVVTMGIPETYEDKIVNGDATDSIQGKNCSIIFNVTAVQGNAVTYDPVVPNPDWDGENIEDVADFMAFRDAVNAGDTMSGKTITLKSNLDLGGIANWEPIGGTTAFRGTFEGGNHTISNLTVNYPEKNYVGLFGWLNGTVQNVTISNANVTGQEAVGVAVGRTFNTGTISKVTVLNSVINGNHWVGGVAGYQYGNIMNCKVDGLELTATPNIVNGKHDNGDKVGGIVGFVPNDCYAAITGNSVANATISGYREVGGLTGNVNVATSTFTDNTVETVTLIVDRTVKDTYESVRPITVYEIANGEIDGSNTAKDVTIKYVGLDAEEDVAHHWSIYSAEGLIDFATRANNDEFKAYALLEGITTMEIMQDIDLAGFDWEPLNAFRIAIVGNGHTISNINVADCGRAGFLSYLGGCTMKDLTLENVTASGKQVGAIVARFEEATISNVTLAGEVNLTWSKGSVTGTGETEDEKAGVGAFVGVWENGYANKSTFINNANVTITVAEGVTSILEVADNMHYFGYLYSGNTMIDTSIVSGNGTIVIA